MSEKINRDSEWTRLVFLDDSDSESFVVLSVRDAGVEHGEAIRDSWRNWEYTVEMHVPTSGANDAVPAGEYIVDRGTDLTTPVDVLDPMGPLETLASFADSDREHIEYWDPRDTECPEHGEKCLAFTASPELRHFLTTWGEEVGYWASDREEVRLAEGRK